jgi:hypothetical protein
MDWLKINFEKAILGFAALALLVSGGLVIRATQVFPEQFAGRDSAKAPDNTIKPYPTQDEIEASLVVKNPKKWEVHDGSLFVSRPYVLRDGTLIDPTESLEDLHPPIKNSWLLKYELPYWEDDISEQDPDEDRFSNLEEFVAGTNPVDQDSVPPYYTKLRLKEFISVPFRLIFTGSPDDGQTFSINTKDRGGRTQFLELGETIKDTPYVLVSYEKKSDVIDDIRVDLSELVIENTETKNKITLVAKQEANDPTSFGEFLYLFDDSTVKVKKEDEFSLPPETERKYKLIDISETGALIKDLETGEQYQIPPAQ